ncbi:MAG: ABC transporter substrate-binding protein [Spirochaetales bacterium]|nr:ABC transporter substrate-binding protein [Spirochaetales bacterium]
MNRITSALICAMFALLIVFPVAAGGEQEEAGEIVLNFPTFWVGQDSKAEPIAELIEEFNAQHAGEIRVVIEPNPDTDGYRDKLNTQLATGDAPDIFVFNPDPTTFQYYDSELLFDFTDYMTDEWAGDFVTSYLEESTRDGRLKTVPFEIGITPIWYNMTLLQEAGWDAPPATIDEFWQMADALKAADIVPTSQMTGGANAWTSMLWYSHILASLGGPGVWDLPLGDPIYVEAAEVLQRLYSDGNTTRDAVGGDAGVSGGHFLASNTAAFINGPWYIGRVNRDAPAVHAATAIAPAPRVGDYSGHQIGFLLSNLAAGNTDDPRKAEAIVTFMRFMTDPANVAMVSERAGSLFAIRYELGSGADPLQREFVRAASEAEFVVGHFQSRYSVRVVSEFGQALAALALGSTDAQGFFDMLVAADR